MTCNQMVSPLALNSVHGSKRGGSVLWVLLWLRLTLKMNSGKGYITIVHSVETTTGSSKPTSLQCIKKGRAAFSEACYFYHRIQTPGNPSLYTAVPCSGWNWKMGQEFTELFSYRQPQ